MNVAVIQPKNTGANCLENQIHPKHYILLLVNSLLLLAFGSRFILQLNYEFVIYVSVILVFGLLITASFKTIGYKFETLVGLTIWSGMHLAGGGIPVGDGRLYDIILLPLSGSMPIFRYDQLVHIVGFGAATLAMHDLLAFNNDTKATSLTISYSIALLMAGLGVGAFNETVEFLVNCVVPESGVGGYVNTSLDLCSNFIGALLALVYLSLKAKASG